MNTKGIKFLAVLAVMVMAFAAIVVLAPADKDMDAINVNDFKDAQIDPIVITESLTQKYTEFFISDDAIVKVEGLADNITFYVQNGMELELDIKCESSNTITIKSVTGDRKVAVTTSDADTVANVGKVVIPGTEAKFPAQKSQTVIYTALMPTSVKTHTTSDGVADYRTVISYSSNYATISSDVKFIAGTAIGSQVTIASGQSLESDVELDVNCGIILKKTENNETTFTYYAKGVNAGSETLAGDDYAIVKNGSIIVKNGSANIKAASATGTDLKFVVTEDDQVDVSGKLSTGSLTVSGNVLFASGFENAGTITLTGSAKAVEGSYMKVTGTLILKNDKDKVDKLTVEGEGKIVAQNEKVWSYEGVKPYIKLNGWDLTSQGNFKGTIDVTAITKSADVKEAFSTAVIERNQTFRVVADTVVTTSLDVQGVLIIEPGVVLTITKTETIGASIVVTGQYATVINNGTIQIKTAASNPEPPQGDPNLIGLNIEGGYTENNGLINASSSTGVDKATLRVASNDGAGFVNNGTITTSKSDIVEFNTKFTNAATGSVTIIGKFNASSFNNYGEFKLNNATIAGNLTITTKALGATVDIMAVESESPVTITVKNAGAEIAVTTSALPTANATATNKCTVRNIYVTDISTMFVKALDLDGNVSVSNSNKEAGDASLSLKGNVAITGTSSVSDGYEVVFAGMTDATKANVSVSGKWTLNKGVTVTGDDKLVMTVYGKATTMGADMLGQCTYIAAKYMVGENYVYTTLANAISEAAEADVSIVYVDDDKENGKFITVDEDLVIPEGMTVDGSYFVVDDKATIVVKSTARLSVANIVIEDGMITAESSNDIDVSAIDADVEVEDDESTAVACMSLEVALMLATPGDVIELAQTFYTADADFVIPEGVTVDATKDNGAYKFILVNSDLTVNGTLVVDDFAFIATIDDTKTITVNGFIFDAHQDGECFTDSWYTPFGVSYNWTDEDDVTWYVLTSIDNLQAAVDTADDAKVAVEGDALLEDITVIGKEDMPAEVTFKGNVTADTITIENTTLLFTEGKKITATVADALGSITITGAYAGKDLAIYSMDNAGVYMAGAVTDSETGNSTYSIRFDGITGMDGTTKAVIGWTSQKLSPTILFAGETSVVGKKAFIQNDDSAAATGMATVTGTLEVTNASKLTVNSDIQVLGGLVADERTDVAAPGTIVVVGDIFVGTLKDLVYSYEDAKAAYENHDGTAFDEYVEYGEKVGTIGDAAVLSGKIEIPDMSDFDTKQYFITVVNGSIVDPAIVEDLASVDIIIDDEVWITIYGYADSNYCMDGLKAPIYNAGVETILDQNGIEVADFDQILKVIYNGKVQALSAFGEVNITLNPDIFNVKIKTDGSVKAVYIDGILMETGFTQNIFAMANVATGTHKVTVEAATGYDADKCVLYTEMGTILPGMSFTFTEFDCEIIDGKYVVTYNINGTEIQPEPVPPTPEEESQWTVTTILLVILVVLIAIMAVIVALRLNRS